MPDMKSAARLTRLFPFLGFVALGACHVDPNTQNPISLVTSHTFDHANWQQIPGKMKNQVEPITFTHSVSFAAGEMELSEAEMNRLLAFLQESGVHQGARIALLQGQEGHVSGRTWSWFAQLSRTLPTYPRDTLVPLRSSAATERPADATPPRLRPRRRHIRLDPIQHRR